MLLSIPVLFLFFLFVSQPVAANTEKIIFTHRASDIPTGHTLRSARSLKPPYSIYRNECILPRTVEIDPSQHAELGNVPFQRWYTLEALVDNESYEARISYAATTPTDFKLLLLSYSDMIKIANFSDLVPHLVDSTNGQQPISIFPNQFLLVEGVFTGVSYIPSAKQNPVSYNIVLEKVYLGGIPYQAGKLAVAIIASLFVGIFVIVPWVEQVIWWVVEGNGLETLNSRYLKQE
ncbi:hypothetical protein BC937DRAFT_92051 [Endogone sp. FLAS-F59071]|nr:hypothetical protein BC937DRAFT_92051 [Endogone sp. FLAS-F59071]|eukprot:RUS15745.1 hypothetical protein BC937DRAFT_92051 [Endogone sp. FLAS-F59071]